MGLAVAPAAKGDLPVRGMAVCACDSRVLRHFLLKQVVRLLVAPSTDLRVRGLVIDDLRGFVYRMACHTVFCGHLHCGAMRFVAGVAFRDVSVPISMAVSTGHIRRVFARILLEFIADLAVAKGAGEP